MVKVLQAILNQLDLLTITGKDAERMYAIKTMVKDLIRAFDDAKDQEGKNED